MGKVDKKIRKIEDRIEYLEDLLYTNLKQKTSSTAEIDVAKVSGELQRLRKELNALIA